MVCETRSIIPRHFPYHVLPPLQIGSWESNRGNGNSLRKPHHRPCGAAGAGTTRGSPLPPSPFRPPPSRSFVPVTPLFRLLFHGRAEVSFLNYERTTPVGCLLYEKRRVKLVVVPHRRQRAGPGFLRSFQPSPTLRRLDKPTSTQRAPFLPDSPRGTRK